MVESVKRWLFSLSLYWCYVGLVSWTSQSLRSPYIWPFFEELGWTNRERNMNALQYFLWWESPPPPPPPPVIVGLPSQKTSKTESVPMPWEILMPAITFVRRSRINIYGRDFINSQLHELPIRPSNSWPYYHLHASHPSPSMTYEHGTPNQPRKPHKHQKCVSVHCTGVL